MQHQSEWQTDRQTGIFKVKSIKIQLKCQVPDFIPDMDGGGRAYTPIQTQLPFGLQRRQLSALALCQLSADASKMN